MKIKLQFAVALSAMLMITNTSPVFAANSGKLPDVTASPQNTALLSDGTPPGRGITVSSGDLFPSSDTAIPGEAPMFSAHVELFHGQGYIVKGTFSDFLPDTILVQPMYSLDGEVWQNCDTTWDLQWLGTDTADALKALQNQRCLKAPDEPLADYLAGQLDRFYLKLQITLESGLTYETQTAVIDRGDPQPIPEDLHPVASFVSDMLIRQWRPYSRYGQYQITVSANASPEDISALLPDTLPIEVQFYKGINMVTNTVVDCPVSWKPLTLSRLTPGESVTVADAAEEIIVPAGTLLNTPNGIFQLSEPLNVEDDEIRLVLNVVAENAEPTGVLFGYFEGLELSFHLKPTGAAAIRAYTLSEGESKWVEIPEPLLPEEVNAPSSTASSIYTILLKSTSEPYQSYLAARNAGEEPVHFLVGLKIEGGVYDGRQLILSWPDTYKLPAKLPDLNGSGGNECNAGSDNKNDSTSEGQRPGLPQDPNDGSDGQEPELPQDPNDGQETQKPDNGQNTQEPGLPQDPNDGQETQKPDNGQNTQEPGLPQDPNNGQETQKPDNGQNAQELEPSQEPDGGQNMQKPERPQHPEDGQNIQKPGSAQFPENSQTVQNPELTQTAEHKPEAQQSASFIPERRPKGRSDIILFSGKLQPKLSQSYGEQPKDRYAKQLRPLENGTGRQPYRKILLYRFP